MLAIALAVPLLFRTLELRLPGMTRPFWQDEVHHNIPVVESATVADFDGNGMYLAMVQPKLDFWLRKVIWFRLFGVNERAMRIPALGFGVALVMMAYWMLLAFLRESCGLRRATWLAFIGALWVVDNPMAIRNTTEARHYSMVIFASTLWFALLMLRDGKPRLLFAAASLFLANSHFFALPLIACGYGLQLFREIRARNARSIAFHLLTCLLIYECTIRINGATFSALLNGPPGDRGTLHAPLRAMFTGGVLHGAWDLWLAYARALALPPATWAVWLLMLVAAIVGKQVRWAGALLTTFLLLPAMFAYMRFRSQYPWGDRYFSPFFGLGIVTLGAAIDIAWRAWQRHEARLTYQQRRIAGSLAVAGFACLMGAPAFAYRSIADVGGLHRIPKNFSPWYRAYQEIWAEQRPTVVLHDWCSTSDIPHFYLRYVLPKSKASFIAFDLCTGDVASIKAILEQYLAAATTTRGMIVFDEKETDCSARPPPPSLPSISVERVHATTQCMWKVWGARTVPQLAEVARLVGFRGAVQLR